MHGWRCIKTLYWRELIHLLRDRHTLIYSVAIPVFLYPTILFFLFQSMAVVEGWSERQVSRVMLTGAESDALLEELIRAEPGLELVAAPASDALTAATTEELGARVRDGRVDAVVRLTRGGVEPAGAAPTLAIEVIHSGVRDASAAAARRLDRVFEAYGERRLVELARRVEQERGLLDILSVEDVDVASGERKANYVLSMTMPLLMVVIILMGAFYPALDATAGERERLTIETTLVAPVPRVALVLGKYLAVVTLGLLAFVLNFASMTFSFEHLIAQVKVGSFAISPASLLVVLAGAVLLALLLAAIMMAVAFLARSFKEGQSYMAPLYLIGLGPVVVTLSPEIHLTPLLSAAPIVNITMVFREVLQGRFDWPLIGATLGFSALWTALAICVAAWTVSRESFLFGDGSSLFARLLRARRGRPR